MMSCNGCRVLRKGCSEECMLRHCLTWIEKPEGQAHATLFVAKFFGRATLMSFLSSVPPNQTPALFQSLLYEAVGRTINPVSGAVGLLWTGKWQLCQLGVEKVLRGATTLPHFLDQTQIEEGFGSNHPSSSPSTRHQNQQAVGRVHKQRAGTPSQESDSTTLDTPTPSGSEAGARDYDSQSQRKLLQLFFS